MKTIEFKKGIEALGFHVETHKFNYMQVFTDSDCEDYFLAVGSLGIGDLKVVNEYMGETEKYAKAVKLAVEYVFTPLAERGEPKKYKVHLFAGEFGYLVVNNFDGEAITSWFYPKDRNFKCVFTIDEYEKIRKGEWDAGFFTVLPPFDETNTKVFEEILAGEDE